MGTLLCCERDSTREQIVSKITVEHLSVYSSVSLHINRFTSTFDISFFWCYLLRGSSHSKSSSPKCSFHSFILISWIFLLTVFSSELMILSTCSPFSTNKQISESLSPSILRSLMLADPINNFLSSAINNFEWR